MGDTWAAAASSRMAISAATLSIATWFRLSGSVFTGCCICLGFLVWGFRFGVWDLRFKFGVLGFWGFGVLGFWGLDLGFGVWGLGFGVWGLEFGIRFVLS